jgi:hypothetical protein
MAENERLGAIMNTEIVKFKRIVKNIIAGNNVSRAEIMNLYKETVQEQVEKRVETLLPAIIFLTIRLNLTISVFMIAPSLSFSAIIHSFYHHYDQDAMHTKYVAIPSC